MRITLDPPELFAVSETLRSCSIEAADIGSQLLACAGCPMPAELQPVVDGLVAGADRSLDSVAGVFSIYAADLGTRAQIAATDSLTAAASSVDTNPLPSATSSASGVAVSTIGGQLAEPIIFGDAPSGSLTVSTIGGQSLSEPIIFGSGSTAGVAPGLIVSSIGGATDGLGLAPGGSPLIVSTTGGGGTGLSGGGVAGLPPLSISVIAGQSLFAGDPNGYMAVPAGNQYSGVPASTYGPSRATSAFPLLVGMETNYGTPAPATITFPI